MFKFANYHFVYLLWVIPLLGIMLLYTIKKKKRLIRTLGSRDVIDRLHRSTSFKRQVAKILITLFATSLLTFALMGPQMGTVLSAVKREGIDIVVVIDVSRSMQAEDLSPNRLDRAKFEISRFIDRLERDRLGLVAFAGASYLQVPLTLDYAAVKMMLDVLDSDIIGTQGTATADAINTAVHSFKSEDASQKVILILTDGEDHEDDPVEAAEEAFEHGIRIYTVGFASVTGAPIPLYDKRGNRIGFKRDEKDQIVTSRLNETVLDEIAGVTGGRYFRIRTRANGLEMVYNEISQLEKSEIGSREFAEYKEWYQYAVGFVLMLLFIEPFIPEKRKTVEEWHGRYN